MKTKCLLLRLPDERKFCTKIENEQNLIEFAKNFNIQLHHVEVDTPEILDLKELSVAICNKDKKGLETEFLIIESKHNKIKCIEQFTKFSKLSDRQKSSSKSKSICNYIVSKFKEGGKVNVKKIAKKLKKYNISNNTIYRYINQSKKILEKDGLSVVKVSVGVYIAK